MECRIYTESLTALMDGELAAEEAATIRAHLTVCKSCDAEYSSLRYSYNLVGRARLIDSQPTAWTLIESRIRTTKRKPGFLRNLLFPNIWVPIGAVAALILFTSFLFLFVPSENHSVAMHQALTKYVQERNRELHSKGALAGQGVGAVRQVHYNPFREDDPTLKGNPFKAE